MSSFKKNYTDTNRRDNMLKTEERYRKVDIRRRSAYSNDDRRDISAIYTQSPLFYTIILSHPNASYSYRRYLQLSIEEESLY